MTAIFVLRVNMFFVCSRGMGNMGGMGGGGGPGGMGNIFNIGKVRPATKASTSTVRFKDVAGCDEGKVSCKTYKL